MKKLFERFKAKDEQRKSKKGKGALAMLGATGALAALAPAAGAAPLDFTGIDTGLTVPDAVSSGISFMTVLGDWAYLTIGILIAMAIIGTILWLVNKLPNKGRSRG